MSTSEAITVEPVRTAREIAVLVRESAAESEQLGTMAPQVVDALRESRLFWVSWPEEMGGLGASVTTMIEVTEVLSNADGSTGWSYMVNAAGAMMACFFCSDEAFAEACSGPELPICAGVGAPTGVVTPVEGGFMGTGQWSFGSGSRHADWLMARMVNAGLGKEAQAAEFTAYMFPRSAVEFRGNWDVMGLMGTGSVDFGVTDQFIPAHRAVDMTKAAQRGGIVGQLGNAAIGIGGHIGVPIGVASRALEEIAVYTATKRRFGQTGLLADADLFRAGFAQQEATFHAMRGLVYETFAALQRRVEDGGTVDEACIQRIRQVNSYAHYTAAEIVQFCYEWGGAYAFRNPSSLGRCIRDMLVAKHHVIVDRSSMVESAAPLLERWRQGPQTELL